MIRHNIRCTVCTRTETHGSVAPEHPQSCHTARMMRMQCRSGDCDFELVQEEYTPDRMDNVRMAVERERVLIMGENGPYVTI